MDTQEYLGVVAILESARNSLDAALPYTSGTTTSRLREVIANLEKAILAYREKADAPRS
jgi:hypothetical protein